MKKLKKESKYAVEDHENILGKHNIPLIRSIYKRIYKKNKNCLIIIVGDVGEGKSYLALKICNEFDPEGFNHETLEKRTTRKPIDFIKIVANRDELKIGSALLLDEAGTMIPADEWYSFNNKAIRFILQTFRYKRLLVVWTVPSLDLVDKRSRKFFNYLINTLGYTEENLTKCKIYELSYSKKGQTAGKIYYKYPRYMENGRKRVMVLFKFKKIYRKLAMAYEKFAGSFKDELLADLQLESEKITAKEKRRIVDVRIIAEKIIANKKRYFKVWGNKMIADQQRIELDFEVGGGYAKRAKELAENIADERNIFNLRKN